jgi:hypothetical protein
MSALICFFYSLLVAQCIKVHNYFNLRLGSALELNKCIIIFNKYYSSLTSEGRVSLSYLRSVKDLFFMLRLSPVNGSSPRALI